MIRLATEIDSFAVMRYSKKLIQIKKTVIPDYEQDHHQ